MNPANAITSLRIILVPIIAYAAFTGNKIMFASLFILGGLTDILDGFIARRLKQHSSWGSGLDTIADMLFYPVGLLCALFVPEFAAYWKIMLALLATMGLAMLICTIRGTFPAIHRWPSKITAAGLFLFILFTTLVGFSTVFFSLVALLVIWTAVDRVFFSRHT
ncbi:MAG TPA: CDP-alcohol phosphatidyltransferase family protein [Candidatus Nanoarchaeia archaeon]|nr:CDP-alcohol phosphatidyltransferase family protein [Candidatus Nanoarchaeia archaeon]